MQHIPNIYTAYLLGKFGPKTLNYLFKLEFGTYTNFRVEIPLFGKFGPKTQNCQFKLKFGTETNSNMQNSMVMFTFSVVDRKHLFGPNLVQKITIVSLG